MIKTLLVSCLAISSVSAKKISGTDWEKTSSAELEKLAKPLSPEEAIEAIEVPKGYKLELVTSEPTITEPVDCVWDANGDMYVIEMTTYMQDADATGQYDKTSRVMKLVDTDGDGKIDKSTVFADGLLLPRMILPLDDRILICETDTLDIYAYRDTNGDGKADEKKIWFEGGARKGNLEHQASGLIWNLDNWIYLTKGDERFRIVDGEVVVDKRGNITTQWGLDHDDDGNISSGYSGAEKSFQYFQNPIVYTKSQFPNELEKNFNSVWPIDNIPDTQGARRRLREDNTLNHMTGACGHGVYRGELMPDFYGNYVLAEPVGRLVRMAKVDTSQGFRQMQNAYPESEFIRSADANFRPVNIKTGPDGALYIVDMYRGIIQEGHWTQKGSYLRDVIDKYGMGDTVKNGRIYRMVPENYNKKFTPPRMLEKKSSELIPYLGSTNGWMRSTARKVIILRNEKSIVPQLKAALDKSNDTQEKIEILWTLEGLQALDPEFVFPLIRSKDSRFATHALRVSDPWLQEGNSELLDWYEKIYSHSTSPELLTQAVLSMKTFGPKDVAEPYLVKFNEKHKKTQVVEHHLKQWSREQKAKQDAMDRANALKGKGPLFEKIMTAGEKHYASLCFACHGAEGEGAPMAGTDTTLAPALADSPRVLGDKDTLIKIVLHGLTGPIDGKTYPGAMESLAAQDDQYLAEVLSYIRNSWGNKADIISSKEVGKTRRANRKRKTPWTMEELTK
ncbi:DUF7133 domain-containing protein [Rubritalea sp.]|uniref:DUF7133 domain-containing protein n=1 Tax=Rubritalea sp. TaxID=2109375 RepID=UPI003EF75F83